jgi:hypothetical protein
MGTDEVVSGRPFVAVEKTKGDLETLHAILSDVRGVAVEVEEGVRQLEPYQKLAWRSGGYTHRLLVCDSARVTSHPGLCVVGFFGDKRPTTDPWDLEEANSEIVAEFAKYPGILAYASVELPMGHWANMVLHDDPIDTEFWRSSQMHANAVESLSPKHYFNVRIHNGHLTSSIFDRPRILIQKTKYFDYTGREAWRAERTLAPG